MLRCTPSRPLPPPSRASARAARVSALVLSLLLTACGGGGDGAADGATNGDAGALDNVSVRTSGQGVASGAVTATINGRVDAAGDPIDAESTIQLVSKSLPDAPTNRLDAVRFLEQSSFGPSESTVAETMQRGPRKQLMIEFAAPASRYTYTLPANAYRAEIDTLGLEDFCSRFTDTEAANCWLHWYSAQPVAWDFYRQASTNRDQLRQRVAFALSQIFVVSATEVDSAYGLAYYQQMLRDNAFGNIRTLLRGVTLSPMMGRYLNMVDNEAIDPNENFARELLQLFTIGTCRLNANGTLATGKCVPTYDNNTVRNYAYALTGWTYPAGGSYWWCNGKCNGWKYPRYGIGEMQSDSDFHDKTERALLSGVVAPSGRTPQQGLDAVLDSVIAHPNIGPFLGKQLIQHLVTSNPSPAYVGRVTAAFDSGTYADATGTIGSGVKGDLQATLAAILLDSEARDQRQAGTSAYGRLKDPMQLILASIRALDGVTDGARFGQWGSAADMGQPAFTPPSVFSFYPPDFPLPGTTLVAPQFGIANANTAIARINFVNDLLFWWDNKGEGLSPDPSVHDAVGTRVSLARWENMIDATGGNSASIVERLSELLTAGRLSAADKLAIVRAMNVYTSKDTWLADPGNGSNWKHERIKTAAYLIMSSPHYQVQR
ncbi:MAG: DUF1800 domain-containing protein [Burkholderiaceae bacterium]